MACFSLSATLLLKQRGYSGNPAHFPREKRQWSLLVRLLRWDGAQVSTADTVFSEGTGASCFSSAECLAQVVLQSHCSTIMLPFDSMFVCV